MPADFVLSSAEVLQLGAAQDVDIAGEEGIYANCGPSST